jgi:hypothetical protein
MGVDHERANRSRHATTSAFGARGGQIRDEQLTQDSSRRISIDSKRVAKTLACDSSLG